MSKPMSATPPRGVATLRWSLWLTLLGCGGRGDAGPTGPGTGGSTTAEDPDACMASSDCTDAVCVAPWDADLGQRGPAACVLECIADDDLARFCLDDASCCDGSLCNLADGLCAPESAESTGSTTADTATGTGDTSGSTSGASSGDSTSSTSNGTSSSG